MAYANEDKRYRKTLARALAIMRRDGLVSSWYDGEIIEGTEWRPEIFKHLREAQLILLLVSPSRLLKNQPLQTGK